MNTFLLLLTLWNPALKKDRILIQKEYEIDDPGSMTIIIDNINGDVEVSSSNDNKVYLSVEIQISGYNDALVEKAKSELQLGQVLADDSLTFFTKAPFIKKNQWGYDMRNQPKYSFKYQYKVRVRKETSVEAKTIDHGDVTVSDIEGAIRVGNVNGAIEVNNARVIETASTVNGDVTIHFLEPPTKKTFFHTVNGDFNFTLPESFTAQVYFDSMNGDLYTAFDYQKLGPKVTKSEKEGRYKIGSNTGIEIGSGGPELSFKSINGNVYLKKSE